MFDFKAARMAAGYGFDEAVALLKTSRTTLWRYENGKTKRKDSDLIERMRSLYKVGRTPAAS